MKSKLAVVWILCFAFLSMLCACENQQPAAEVTSEETAPAEERSSVEDILAYDFYDEMDANAYSKHLRSIFVSLMPQCMDAEQYGLGCLAHDYGCADTAPGELDEITTHGGGIYWISESSIPAFYGLLSETEMILSATGNRHEQDGNCVLYADEVEAVASRLLRGDVKIRHQSTAGAIFDDVQQCYRYEKLEDPLEPFYANNWELIFLGNEADEDTSLGTFATAPFWQDRDNGDLYSFSGDLLCTKCQRPYLTGVLYTNYFLKLGLWAYGENIVPLAEVVYEFAVAEDGTTLPFDEKTPVRIRLGTSCMTIPDLSAYEASDVDLIELCEEGQ